MNSFHLVRVGGVQVIAIALVLWASAHAHADVRVGPVGGGGGGAFAARCPAGQLLTGFEMRVGDDVDALRPLCVLAYDKTRTSPVWVSSNLSAQQAGIWGLGGREVLSVESGVPNPGLAIVGDRLWYGGGGGRPRSLVCPYYAPIMLGVLIEAEGESTVVVHEVEIHCGEAFNAQSPEDRNFPRRAFWKGAPPSRYCRQCAWGPNHVKAAASCPVGTVAVGIHGRSGKWLDAVGLICDFPQWAPAPPGPPPPRPPKTKGDVRLDAPAQRAGVDGAFGQRSATAPAVAPAARVDRASAYGAATAQTANPMQSKSANASLNPQPLPPRQLTATEAPRSPAWNGAGGGSSPTQYAGIPTPAAAPPTSIATPQIKAQTSASPYGHAMPHSTLSRPGLAANDVATKPAVAPRSFIADYGVGPIFGGSPPAGAVRVSIVPAEPSANALVLFRAEGISRYCEGAGLRFGDGTPEEFVPLGASQSPVSPPQRFERSHSYHQPGTYTIEARVLSGNNNCPSQLTTLKVVVQ